jgi:hypothetical protein
MIANLRATPASDADAARGLLGYLKFEYGSLVVDGVTLRRRVDGTLGLSWPERTDRAGRRHALLRPLDDNARRELEAAVLAEISRQELQRQDGAK